MLSFKEEKKKGKHEIPEIKTFFVQTFLSEIFLLEIFKNKKELSRFQYFCVERTGLEALL